jgi:glycosyltransferase involved in cell wall biosynthesis
VYVWVSNRITKKAIADGILAKNKVKTIYNGINTSVFNKKDKTISRQELWLPLSKKIIISIAGSGGKSTAKGLQYVNKIIDQYKNNPNILFITLWNFESKKISDNLREIWYISQEMVSKYFNSADIFLYPTLMDSFGLVVSESISCWCPVVTFETWWVPEIVKHKKDWYVAICKDYTDLVFGFERVLNNVVSPKLDDMFTQQRMVDEYSDLYFSLFDKTSL